MQQFIHLRVQMYLFFSWNKRFTLLFSILTSTTNSRCCMTMGVLESLKHRLSAHLHIQCPSTFTEQEGDEIVFTVVQIRIFQGISRQQLTGYLLQLLTLQLCSKAELGDTSCLRGFFLKSIAPSDWSLLVVNM